MNAVQAVDLDAAQARVITDRIKVAVEGTWQLIQEAYVSRAWAALGYGSWDDYCTREFGTSRLRLPREERQEVVASLREIGMSVRAIAAATGNSVGTVHAELSTGVQNRTPATQAPVRHDLDDVLRDAGINPNELDEDEPLVAHPTPTDPAPPVPRPITGTDGKTYTQPARSQTAPPRAPLPPQFQAVTSELTRVIARVERLQADDRYRPNRAAIGAHCLPEIRRAVSVLHDLLLDLGHDGGDPPG